VPKRKFVSLSEKRRWEFQMPKNPEQIEKEKEFYANTHDPKNKKCQCRQCKIMDWCLSHNMDNYFAYADLWEWAGRLSKQIERG